ncbi:hypothetical protein RQM47_04850 [Rubrivirga sp. S365]|uniref:HPr kinase/phosphorylase C-terminal domain-containing protein n=1 Tax=Rubrivirga litoralis TaxID=3075598 RepID=A0ABU3BQ28_9BACT|nr:MULTISPECIES: hypothetical protein [unclassified Rubrivirga]MDT0631370.1 hypothetical protein [Rubrivirga sp. F394]MDT7855961.1 hypothetical protein [Rubrivirga sp. S365]
MTPVESRIRAAPPDPSSGAASYSVFGLRLRSALPLPGLRPAPPSGAGGAEVVVRRGPVDAPGPASAYGIAGWPGDDADTIVWRRDTRLRITASDITVDTADDAFARQCVLGPGLGVLLHRRGRLVLHGSAVDVGGRAVVLVGDKGAGKSTTAAALVARGHRLLTDDLVALDEDAGGAAVLPGPTQMKLWSASASALGVETEPFMDGIDKGVWHGAAPAERAAPLALVCSLGWGERVALTPLAGGAAFGDVFGHVYAPRFLGAQAGAPLVGRVAGLLQGVRAGRLVRPRDLGAVDALAEAIETAVAA